MESTIEIYPGLVIPDLRVSSWEDALSQLSDRLVRSGCARQGYGDAVIERERAYPTGIAFPSAGVAIPHADATWANRTGVAVGRCEKSVSFRSMEDASQTVPVRLVFMLAVTNPDAHLVVLGRLIEMLSQAELCEALSNEKDATRVAQFVDTYVNQGDDPQ